MRSQDPSILKPQAVCNKYINLSFIVGVALTPYGRAHPGFGSVFGPEWSTGWNGAFRDRARVCGHPVRGDIQVIVRIIQKRKKKKSSSAA